MRRRLALLAGVAVAAIVAVWGLSTVQSQEPIDPASVELTLSPGESAQVEKTVSVPGIPAVSDVLIAMDLTGSMGEELTNLQTEIGNIANDLQATGSDVQMGLVSFEDYPQSYDSNPTCDYVATYGSASSGDEPFRVDQPITDDFDALNTAVGAMVLKFGSDGPEGYARALWEAAQDDSGINWRPGATRLVVMFLDNVPHDCDLDEGIDSPPPIGNTVTGIDPGRNETIDFDGDDIDWQDDALAEAQAAGVRLLVIESNGVPGAFGTHWSNWADLTGGAYVAINSDGTIPGEVSLSDTIIGLITQAVTDLEVSLVADCGDDPLELSFDPPSHTGVAPPAELTFTETVTVPEGTAPGTYTCTVTATVDGSSMGEELVTVTVPPEATSAPPQPTATAAAAVTLPETGATGDGSGGSVWAIAALAGAGLTAAAGLGLLRLRTRRA